ncbi:hypothetical protein R6Z07F_019059 [Ovis aries]
MKANPSTLAAPQHDRDKYCAGGQEPRAYLGPELHAEDPALPPPHREARLTLHPDEVRRQAGQRTGGCLDGAASTPVPPATGTTRPDSPVPPPPTDTDASSESSPVCH